MPYRYLIQVYRYIIQVKSGQGLKMGVEKFREENTCELLDTKRRSAADGTLKLLPYEGLENITALILFWAELLSTRAIPTRIAL